MNDPAWEYFYGSAYQACQDVLAREILARKARQQDEIRRLKAEADVWRVIQGLPVESD